MLKDLRFFCRHQLHRPLWGVLLLLTACSNPALVDRAETDRAYQQSVLAAKAVQWQMIDRRAEVTPIVGYKVALAGSAAQNMFGLSSPVVGALFSDTVLASPQRIDHTQFQRLAFEADLLAVVNSAEINEASSIESVAEHISHIMAFVELPLLSVAPHPYAGPDFIKSNAAVKWGVSGTKITATADQVFIDSLATMTVKSFNAQGTLLSSNRGGVIMCHPYQAILFLLQELKAQSRSLKAGDIISLGSFSKPTLVGEMKQLTVIYRGLKDDAEMRVEVDFTP
jgi:2-keto-4-pentenoate hydratase